MGRSATLHQAVPYIENRRVHDADAHIMETPTWLRDHADPAIRDRIEPPAYVNELRQGGDNESQHAKIADIDAKMAALRRMRRALTDLTKACEQRTPTTECPILA